MTSTWSFLAHGIGCLYLTKYIYEAASFFWCCFFRPGLELKKVFNGDWAVVTGATDGIGKAVALELAEKQGLKILLISRNPERLEETRKEVEAAYKRGSVGQPDTGVPNVECLTMDMNKLGAGDTPSIDKVKAVLRGKKIAVLYNNVGIGYDHPEYFDSLDDDLIQSMINLNVGACCYMTKVVVKEMLSKDLGVGIKSSVKKRGCVVNISSTLGCFDCPFYAAYSGTKDFMTRFSNCNAIDYNTKGICFQAQDVCYVTSKLSKIRNPSITTPTPENFAKASVKACGYDVEISPYWSHYLITGLSKNLPVGLLQLALSGMLAGMRSKALKKKAAEGKKD